MFYFSKLLLVVLIRALLFGMKLCYSVLLHELALVPSGTWDFQSLLTCSISGDTQVLHDILARHSCATLGRHHLVPLPLSCMIR